MYQKLTHIYFAEPLLTAASKYELLQSNISFNKNILSS